ncbi:MAG: hypothetical protein ACREL3_00325 [Gemmatimonadales bacterium]
MAVSARPLDARSCHLFSTRSRRSRLTARLRTVAARARRIRKTVV